MFLPKWIHFDMMYRLLLIDKAIFTTIFYSNVIWGQGNLLIWDRIVRILNCSYVWMELVWLVPLVDQELPTLPEHLNLWFCTFPCYLKFPPFICEPSCCSCTFAIFKTIDWKIKISKLCFRKNMNSDRNLMEDSKIYTCIS
jgi:hypothetical protein